MRSSLFPSQIFFMVMTMLVAEGNSVRLLSQCNMRNNYRNSPVSRHSSTIRNNKRNDAVDLNTSEGGLIESIRDKFGKVRLSVSSYDTAWVGMVPSKANPNEPCFPECLNWILENQQQDGSWSCGGGSLLQGHPNNVQSKSKLLVKDSLSSTLACLLALQKWQLGDKLVKKGLDFIGENKLAINDKHQSSPIGFDFVFPGMIIQAQQLGLNLPIHSDSIHLMLRTRHLQLNRLKGERRSLAYIGEGLGECYDWSEAINKHQRSNGSLFNSPATTAAAFTYLDDHKCYQYLHALLNICGQSGAAAVPVTYPSHLYTRLCLVDTLHKLGIDRYFKTEIENVLHQTYSSWQQRNEDIFLDVACHAMAFRVLRMNGYDIPSDTLAEFVDQERFFTTAGLQFTDTSTILELYRASEIQIYPREPILQSIQVWTSTFLKNRLLNEEISNQRLSKKVENDLSYSLTDSLDRLANRRYIELYDPDDYQMLKTSYRCYNVNNMDILRFSIQDFNNCQAIHREELHRLEKWAKDWRLDSLKLDHHILVSSYFQVAAVFFAPELSDARLVFGKNSTFGTIMDDLFDIDGSREELLNIIDLVKNWDEHSTIGFCSKRIEILFSVLKDTVNEFTAKALIQQGRCIKYELIEMWLIFLQSMLREVEWWRNDVTPSLEEYSKNGSETIGIGIFVNSLYFVGPELPAEIQKSEEYITLYHLAGKNGCLLNDYQGLEREKDQRKLNGCRIVEKHAAGNGGISGEEARMRVWRIVDRSKREALRMNIQETGSIVPKAIKDSFYKCIKIVHYLYTKGDEYRRPGITKEDIKAVIYDPIPLPNQCNANLI